jgi:AsmA-like protein
LRRALKWLIGIGAVVAVLLIVATIALPRLVDTPRVQAMIAGSATQAIGRPVKFESLSVKLFPLPAVELHKLEVAEDPQFGTSPFLTLETGRVYLKLRPLLGGRVEFGDVTLERPRIALIQRVDGRLNVASLAPASEPRAAPRPGRSGGAVAGGAAAAVVSQVKIVGGIVTYVALGKETAPTPYRIESLDLTLTTQVSQLNVKGTLRVNPGDLLVKLSDGAVALNGARAPLEAPLRGRVGIEGKDIEPLVAAAAGSTPAIAGPIKGDFTLGGTLGAPRASGTVELASLRVTRTSAACPEPKRRTLALGALKLAAVSWDGARLQSRPTTTSFAGGTISTNLIATLDRGVHVQLGDLNIKGLPAEKVLVDFLCEGYAVAGPLDLTGALKADASDLWNTLDGSGRLKLGPGRVVGPQALALVDTLTHITGVVSSLLAADVPRTVTSSPVDFESIVATYQITNGVVTTRDFLYTSRTIKVGVVGDYGLASGRMNLDLRAQHARGEFRAHLSGSAASPTIKVDPSSVTTNVSREELETGIQDLLNRFRRR